MLSRAQFETYLQEEGLEYHPDAEDPDRIIIIFQTRTMANVTLDVSILNSRTVLFLSRLPLHIPADRRAEVCDYITRVNYGVVLGGFELELDEGDLNYKIVGALGRENEMDAEAFRRLLYLGNGMIDKYAPGVMAVLYGGQTGRDAYAALTKK